VLTLTAYAWRRPSSQQIGGAVLAAIWNVPILLALNVAAGPLGWWQFDASGGLLLGVPVDLYLSWAWIWGAVAALACPRLPLAFVVALALAFDLVLMPAAAPVLRPGPSWLIGEALGLAVGLVPGQLLARWTARQERLAGRVILQACAFAGLLFFVIPATAIEGSGGRWLNPFERPAWQLSLIVQILAVPAVLGLTAVQEFATRGAGTPVPFDPPGRLVTTGVYAYIRNPMQLSAVVVLFLLGVVLDNLWVSAAAIMAHFYAIGFAGWDEDEDLKRRFGSEWVAYRSRVRHWWPRARPSYRPDEPSARLLVLASCDMCREVGRWFRDRGARSLLIVPAEGSLADSLTRITYKPADGSPDVSGVEAIARALEHIHFGWAMLGWVLRLPGVCQCAQLLVDASGGEPRNLPRPSDSRAPFLVSCTTPGKAFPTLTGGQSRVNPSAVPSADRPPLP
jgi:protein-S-isoprenylcysteine O-methyltransferase Ste14